MSWTEEDREKVRAAAVRPLRKRPEELRPSLHPIAAGRLTATGLVAAFLRGMLKRARENENLASGEIGPGPDVRALERVIAMLGEK